MTALIPYAGAPREVWRAFLADTDQKSRAALISEQRDHSTAQAILDACVAFYGVSIEEIKGLCKSPRTIRPRHVAMSLMRQMTSFSCPEIGRLMGGRDDSTVNFAIRKMTKAVVEDDVLCAEVESIRRAIADRSHA